MKRFIHAASVYLWHAVVCAAIVALVVTAFWSFSYTQSVHRRHRAERLLQQLRGLPLGAAGFSGVQQVVKEHGATKECNGDACRYDFKIDFGLGTSGPRWTIRRTEWDHFGLRPWWVVARIETSKDEVKDVEFATFVGVGRGLLNNVGLFAGNEWAWVATSVMVNSERFEQYVPSYDKSLARTRQRMKAGTNGLFVMKPSGFEIGGGREILQVYLAPDAPLESRRVGFDIDLRCTTAARPCTQLCQLTPSAWRRYAEYMTSNGLWVPENGQCSP